MTKKEKAKQERMYDIIYHIVMAGPCYIVAFGLLFVLWALS